MKIIKLIVVVNFMWLSLAQSETAFADCLSPLRGMVVLDVQSCEQVIPETRLTPSKPGMKWLKDLDPNSKAQLFAQYRGLYLKGTVVLSQIKRDVPGGGESAALLGQTISGYAAPQGNSQALNCAALSKKKISVQVSEVCCNGGSNAPCLLNTPYMLSRLSTNLPASAQSSVPVRAGANSKNADAEKLEQAKYLLKEKRYKEGIKAMRELSDASKLDAASYLFWGQTLMNADNCKAALYPFKELQVRKQEGRLMISDPQIDRKALFLQARCHARLNEVSESIYILNGYLLNPEKYSQELDQALKNSDFGFISSSKEYREFRTNAREKLRKAHKISN